MITQVTYNTVPGANSIHSALLIGRTVLSVDRIGSGQTQISILFTPVSPEFKKVRGFLTFDANVPFEVGEKLNVLFS